MKRLRLIGLLILTAPIVGLSQITFDGANSTWGSGNAFSDMTTPGVWRTDITPDGSTAYAAGATSGDFYVFGFANQSPSATAHYDLSGTDLSAGTVLTLTFTGLSAAPNYVAMTGGELTAYNYNAGTLTLTTSTVNPVASASDSDGSTLGSVFGLLLDYGSGNNYSGTVFQTDMYWGDITGMVGGYAGSSPTAGINANGINGQSASFIAHLPVSFLQANGINTPNDCIALVQKEGNRYNITIIRELHAGTNMFGDVGYTYEGTSNFDFDGTSNDDYVKATYSNSVWSAGNIGIAAVPEPSAYAAILGAFSLIGMLIYRRRS